MEDVYTIKVRTKPDKRNVYPSERRYSASTVSGLAWVHIALAATSLLLACLAFVNPNKEAELNATNLITNDNITSTEYENNYILIVAPTLITIFGLAAGAASILASIRWYIDQNITWLFVVSCLSSIVSFAGFVMVTWYITTSKGDISEFYKDKVPFKEIFVIKHTDVIEKNGSHMIVALNSTEDTPHLFTKRVLSINILIAAFLEFLWSALSVKISFKGMRSAYKEDYTERRGNCISVVTTIKGNNPKRIQRNGNILPLKLDLIEHCPNRRIEKIFLEHGDNGFYLKNNRPKSTQNTETSSECHKERMMNFLNRCASMESVSNPELLTPSVQSETVLNTIPEITVVEVDQPSSRDVTPVSWGDTPDHTIYNQNNLNLSNIFNFNNKEDKSDDVKE